MKWKYYKPEFEFSQDIFSTWWGHTFFAYDLIRNMQSKKVVELGTHNGVSFFAFCQAIKDGKIDGQLNAIDTWEGDPQAGLYEESVYTGVQDNINQFYPELDIHLIRKTFDEALDSFDDGSVDLLHIDGLHTYDAVKRDFDQWSKKVSPDGVIIFHDIHERNGDFGVYKLWEELKQNYACFEFYHSHGLGVLFMNRENFDHFSFDLDEIKGHYANCADHFFLQLIRKQRKKIKRMESSKFWKARNKYMDAKKILR